MESESEASMSAEVDLFLEHHGVKGMHWGVRKGPSSSSIATRIKRAPGTAVYKTGRFVAKHPRATVAAALVANAAYRHRGEIAATAIVLGRMGKYVVDKNFAKNPEVSATMAIGRQVVQGFVL